MSLTAHRTLYQALSGPDELHRIKIVGHQLYFSLQQKPVGAKKELRFRLSDQQSACATLKEGFSRAGSIEEFSIRKAPCLDLQVQMQAVDRTIIQRTSPHHLGDFYQTLDETFFIGLAAKSRAFFRRASPPISEERSWLVEPDKSNQTRSYGKVIVSMGKFIIKPEDFKRTSDYCPTLFFSVNWTADDSVSTNIRPVVKEDFAEL